MPYDYKQFYRRKLPHRHSPGATLFVTYRLRNSIPRAVLNRRKAELRQLETEIKALTQAPDWKTSVDELERRFQRRWFMKFEDALHLEKGPLWLKGPDIANVVEKSLHFLNGSAYKLHAFCIMANHVHTLFTPTLNEHSLKEVRRNGIVHFESDDPTLDVIMKSLKGYTAREANKLLHRKGQFWEPESFDHEVRDGAEFGRIKRYILNNPVKAGLIDDWKDWKWSWAEPSWHERQAGKPIVLTTR